MVAFTESDTAASAELNAQSRQPTNRKSKASLFIFLHLLSLKFFLSFYSTSPTSFYISNKE